MCDRKETRIVLWGRHQAELLHAQNLDAEVEKLEARAKSIRDDAAECRRARTLHQASRRNDSPARRGNRMIWSRVKAFCLNSLTIAWGYVLACAGVAIQAIDGVADALEGPNLKDQISAAIGDTRTVGRILLGVSIVTILARLRSLRKAA
jgi:hypothetical protein